MSVALRRGRAVLPLAVAALAAVATVGLGSACTGAAPVPDLPEADRFPTRAPVPEAFFESSDADLPPSPGALYALRRGCGDCHEGNSGLSGRTTPRPGTDVYPANLTPDPDTGIGKWSEDQIADAILKGIAPDRMLCDQMPRFAMSRREALAIAAYLKSLPAVRNPIPRSVCPSLR
jgi:mono/diheme cytochrome c family protein